MGCWGPTSALETLLFYQFLYFGAGVFDLHGVIRLFPQHLSLRISDHQSVVLEAERLDGFHRLGRGRIDVLSLHLAGKFRLELAHGGLDLSADRSTRQVVVRHFQRSGRLRPLARGGERHT